jgi:2-polyprenyl-3-methyl-5-hydroxy-6-metoxy-1,4-benzoquinol methylase
MQCLVCGRFGLNTIHSYGSPDKYEKLCGLKYHIRFWQQCEHCGFYQAWRDYDVDELKDIYSCGYRQSGFRSESIEETFNRVKNLPFSESENCYRMSWFDTHVEFKEDAEILDIGSGFGIWPWGLESMGWKVECIEPNKQSCEFINNHLHIPCHEGFFNSGLGKLWDIVSVVHVLEHIKKIDSFISKIFRILKPEGRLFIEVPDACEFDYLPKNNDEFNSCHLWFFDLCSLQRLLHRNGFSITDAHRVYYKNRNLSRIMLLCKRHEIN